MYLLILRLLARFLKQIGCCHNLFIYLFLYFSVIDVWRIEWTALQMLLRVQLVN